MSLYLFAIISLKCARYIWEYGKPWGGWSPFKDPSEFLNKLDLKMIRWQSKNWPMHLFFKINLSQFDLGDMTDPSRINVTVCELHHFANKLLICKIL